MELLGRLLEFEFGLPMLTEKRDLPPLEFDATLLVLDIVDLL
jgi:hypothetical protein